MNLLLYWGDDAFALRKAEEALIEKWVEPQWRAFNLLVLENATAEQVVQAVLTPSFAPGERVVVVRDYPSFQSKGEDEALLSLKIPKDTYLLFSGPAKVDGRLAFTKWVQANGKVSEFSVPKFPRYDEIAGWIEGEVAKRGGRIEQEAAETIAQATGGNQGIAVQEIEKLLTYSRVITLSEIEVLGCGGSGDVFMLANAIAVRDPSKALHLLRRLLLTEKGIVILATLATIVRNWLSVKVLSATHKTPGAIAQALGLKSDFRVKKDLDVCRRWKLEQLKQAVAVVLEADLALKQTGMTDQFVLERMIIKLSAL